MMGHLDRLKGMDSEKCPPSPLPKLPKAPYGSYGSARSGRFQKIIRLAVDRGRSMRFKLARRWSDE